MPEGNWLCSFTVWIPGSNDQDSGHQCWQQVPLLADPLHQSLILILNLQCYSFALIHTKSYLFYSEFSDIFYFEKFSSYQQFTLMEE